MATQPTHIAKSRTTLPIPMIFCLGASGVNNPALILSGGGHGKPQPAPRASSTDKNGRT
jgi:hypothetical protein